MPKGYAGRVLEVDLTSGDIKAADLDWEEWGLYLGGKGMGTRILYDRAPTGVDPFAPENPLIFSTGPLVGTAAPQSNRFTVNTKSPLTGAAGSATSGGDFATRLKKAGFDAVIITGSSPQPVYLEITEEGGVLKDAAHLWGKGTKETQDLLPEKFGKAVIGPAGENRVLFSGIVSGHRVAARTGVGAVMGGKNLKAVIANGKRPVGVERRDEYKSYQKWFTNFLRRHPMTGDVLPRLGTANLVLTTAGRNIIPTFNFQRGRHQDTPRISGQEMTARHLTKNDGCLSCPVKCGREVRYADGHKGKGPEYETLGLIGSNLGVFDLPRVFELADLCDDLGLDTISSGGVLAFATELTERGMLESNLKWGDADAYAAMLEDIAHRSGPLGDALADGVRRASERFGGREFAIHVKGLELPAYDPRGCYGQGLEYATTNRGGCHVQGSTMYMEATGPLVIDPHSTRSKPELVIMQQNLAAAVSSAVMCYFSSYALIPAQLFRLDPQGRTYRFISWAVLHSGPLLRFNDRHRANFQVVWYEKLLSRVTGERWTMKRFTDVGERVFTLERLYNLREGLSAADDTLPPRLLNESTFKGIEGGVPLQEMLPCYYRLRGWDENGVPKTSTIERLGVRTV